MDRGQREDLVKGVILCGGERIWSSVRNSVAYRLREKNSEARRKRFAVSNKNNV